MRFILSLFLLLSVLSTALAEPKISQSVTQVIPGSKAQYGIDNFKMVMPKVLYRGASSTAKGPLSDASLQALCRDHFKTTVYVYTSGWLSNDDMQKIKCSDHEMNYLLRRWDRPAQVHQILQNLHQLIIDGSGPMYVHCWHGIHASGYIATVALMQFCNLSSTQGIAYWNSNVPQKIQYPKVQKMIRDFKPDPALRLSSEQMARVCPSL